MKLLKKIYKWLFNLCECGGVYRRWDWDKWYCDRCGKRKGVSDL